MRPQVARTSRSPARRRSCRFERLEPRRVLAGDVFLVNFQNDEATPPQGYLVDEGLVFGDRGGEFPYGWSTDHSDQARERSLLPDQRFDTLIHFEAGQKWEFALPSGSYSVTVAVGDPANDDGRHTVNAEGINLWTNAIDGSEPLVKTVVVSVTDGRLTLDQGSAAQKATRINFVQIVGLPPPGEPAPASPTITEPSRDGATANPNDVHMEAIGYSDPDGDPHTSTDWEIWTAGDDAELVWQTLGIQGVERLHTHLGDGVFLNSLAGRTALDPQTSYQLRARFRDADGGVSEFAARDFTTTAASATLPLKLVGLRSEPAPGWFDVLGGGIELPAQRQLLSPADTVRAVDLDGDSRYPTEEAPSRAIDGTLAKYLNFGGRNAGLIVTPAQGPSVVTGFQLTTANDAPERDPTGWRLEGTNAVIRSQDNSRGDGEAWTLIGAGTVSLPVDRNTVGPLVTVSNATAYASYRLIFTGLRNAANANSVQVAEVEFFGDSSDVARPASLRLIPNGGDAALLSITGRQPSGNDVTIGTPLSAHAAVRVVIEAGGQPLVLRTSNLAFTDAGGRERVVCLPAVDLAADQRLDLWVGTDGSTYYGTAIQTDPDFSRLARPAPLDVPFVATQGGFVVEQVGSDYRLPVNIAFVPDPGPDPDDPLYFVTELYGSIQVVTRDGSKREFASGLLDYNPQGPISGSGEQGLAGIVVERNAADPDIYQLYVTMLWDNGSPAGSSMHYPKVERLDSVPGGLSLASRTVLLNMQPETQGQSHQISNISIGPDGKLYVHNGDGFVASTARNLNSFRGKVLRLNKDGTAPADNPFYDASDGITARDYVFASGVRNPFGGAWRLADGRHFSVENGPSVDRFSQIERGVDYGWNGTDASMATRALYNWDPSHAPVNITFVEQAVFGGSQFPATLMGHAFVSESGPTYAAGPQAHGKRIVGFEIDDNGSLVGGPTSLVEYVGTGRGTVAALAAGPDGIYFSELYEDRGLQGPTASGARLYRVRYVNHSAIDVPAGQTVTDASTRTGDAAIVKTGGGTVILELPNSHTGGLVVTEGTAIVRDPLAIGTGPLEVAGAGTARLDVGFATVALPQLTLAEGGGLDLGQARITVAPGGGDEGEFRQAIATGRGDGGWDASAGISSSAAALTPAARGIGYLRNPDGSTVIAFTAIGDVDLDLDVDVFDLLAISTAGRYGTGGPASWSQGDVTYDGQTNVFDLVGISTGGAYNTGRIDLEPAGLIGVAAAEAAVPAPGPEVFRVAATMDLSAASAESGLGQAVLPATEQDWLRQFSAGIAWERLALAGEDRAVDRKKPEQSVTITTRPPLGPE